MADTVGEVELAVNLDGKRLPAQARRLGRQVGAILDQQFSRSRALERLTERLGRATNNWVEDLGELRQVQPVMRSVSRSMGRLAITSGDASRGIKDITDSAVILNSSMGESERTAGRFTRAFERVNESGRRFSRTFGRGLGSKLADSFSGMIRTGRKLGGVFRGLNERWKSLSHNARQWTLIIGLVASALPALSVLSSALGGTLVALVTQFAALGTGAGIAIAGFAGLYDETTKLNEGAQASKDAFSDLGDAFKDLQGVITNSMFNGMADSIANITNVALPALRGSIESFAGAVGDSLGRVFDALSSPAAIENFKALLEGFEPIFSTLIDAAISFGGAIGNVLVAALPTAQLFADAIKNVGDRFLEWTASDEGRARIAEWFETAERIMPVVMELVGAVGQALADLVTPETIESTQGLLDALIEFMPTLSGILGVLGDLQIFTVFAELLNAVGAAVTPLLEPLGTLATIISETLIQGFQDLQEPLAGMGEALAPLIEGVGILVAAVLPPLIGILETVIVYITDMATAFFGTGEEALTFQETITVVAAIVGGIIQTLGGIIKVVMTVAGGTFKLIAALLRGDFSGAFKAMEGVVRGVLETLGINFDDVARNAGVMVREVGNFFRDMSNTVGTVVREVGNWLRDLGGFFRDASNVISGVVREIGNFFRDMGGVVNNVVGGIIGTINGISGAIQGVIGWIQDAIGWFSSLFGAANNAAGATRGVGGPAPRMASGGVLYGPQRILAGEAGTEAIVPMNRALSQVDPSVRWLSAIAQGKATPSMASGGVVGGGGQVVVEAGAIRVIGTLDPRATAIETVDRLVERVTS